MTLLLVVVVVAKAIYQATESTGYKSPSFESQVAGAKKAGLVWGAYHFAIPSDASGAKQAKYFLENGGGWQQNNKGEHMPGMLDFEKPPNHPKCYGMSAKEMVAWTKDFSDTYFKETGRHPIIYTGSDWWQECANDSDAFAKKNPLALSQWGDKIALVPGRWGDKPTIWQKDAEYKHGGDSNEFYGSVKELKKFAGGVLYHDIL